MIKAEELFHHYGGKPILKNISFQVNPGEIVVVMGPNGMGKSTLLSCIGGAMSPVGGKVFVDGIERRSDEKNEMAIRQKIMYLPDSPWVPEIRTCRQWAFAVANLYSADEEFLVNHIDALINLFDMRAVADSPISSYSAGQKKKAMLITALSPQTSILILDEPFSGGLDPTGLLAVKEVLRKRARVANNTVLIATPTPELVEEIADRVVILTDGEIVAQGTMDELRKLSDFEGKLEGVYERLSRSDIETRLADYEQKFLS